MSLVMVAKDEAVVGFGVRADGSERKTIDFFGRDSGRDNGAEAFVVELRNRTLGAHVHPVDQFQILLGERGSRIQRRPVPPLMVHYADAYATYGPLIGADPPLRFYTLRAEPTSVTSFVLDDRDKLLCRGQRSIHVDVNLSRAMGVYGSSGVRLRHIIPEDGDGLSAMRLVAEPHSPIVLPSAYTTSGQFVYVSVGAIRCRGIEYASESLGWMEAGAEPEHVVAGDEGTDCLILRLPYPASRMIRVAS